MNETPTTTFMNGEMSDQTPTTTFFFTTWSKPPEWVNYTDLHQLNRYEEVFLITYEVLCTLLTILLNSYLIFIVLYKAKFATHPPSIPILTASLLGLFHGFGCNLIMTVSLINGSWVGSMEWCGAADNIHKYIVYSIIFCQVVVSLEAAYLISHTLCYMRDSTKARVAISIATFIAVFIDLPITVCQFFYLKPSNILNSEWGERFKALGKELYFYDKYLKICYRYFYPGTLDFQVIVYFIHAVNFLAVFLVIFSFIVIALVIIKSRSMKNGCRNVTHDEEERGRKQLRKQNFKIVRKSILSTTCVVIPWLPSLIVSIITEYKAANEALKNAIGPDWYMDLLRLNQYFYYIAPWMFPLMAIITNPAIFRETKQLFLGRSSNSNRTFLTYRNRSAG